MRNLLLFFILIASIFSVNAQEEAWFYLRARDTSFSPSFEKKGDYLIYTGQDPKLSAGLQNYTIKAFKKTQKNAIRENLNKTFFVIADKKSLLHDLLINMADIFESGEIISKEDRKIFEPNDYGLTSTIGDSKGFKVSLDYLDFLELPKAWYYTTGDRNTFVGISDGIIDTTNAEFKGKITVLKKSYDVKGHGSSVASIAVGQGDNSYGVPGVCYDCSIYATTYGSSKALSIFTELADAGAKVINCSWLSSFSSPKIQEGINELLKQGTVIVASAGNKPWSVTFGQKSYYPASYDHVISVSSGMFKYDSIEDNIIQLDSGEYYAENIRGHVGRTVGFEGNDLKGKAKIWPISITTLNKDVDLLAPSVGIVQLAKTLRTNKISNIPFEATSPSAPLVSGTIGLMFSLYPCLPADEVESILKMTAMNIDDIEVNKPYAGMYGAGILNSGRAVEMVFDMFAQKGSVKIENQRFSRWDFKLTSISEVVMRNQKFTEDSSLKLTSKKRIVISENTILKPNSNGKIHLKIDPSLKKECELQLRDPNILND
ncbi:MULTISPECIES: S8 family peptidase [Aequorivita]|uniref:S8 family serine peptidase n=1 Tax=Aequorivita iocasae TaxID=2803865 RepID=A0ABX7DP31_9FLAO|nr:MULTISPECIES: S8 family serine peptidase [Aequorivita]QQX75537.1 S8 family serine peptidase [Aequorivita iocasae]UCA54991.1 S8 family serine peptidase [Aequorivita sp. F7]